MCRTLFQALLVDQTNYSHVTYFLLEGDIQKTLYSNKEIICSLEGDKNSGKSRAG